MQPSSPSNVSDQPVAASSPALPNVSAPQVQAAEPSVAPPKVAAPSAADDGDMIEKEWVTQAKQVLTSNADDPYAQNNAFTRLRADYMKKRYGKDLKVDS